MATCPDTMEWQAHATVVTSTLENPCGSTAQYQFQGNFVKRTEKFKIMEKQRKTTEQENTLGMHGFFVYAK